MKTFNIPAGRIRAVAICICRHAGHILVFEGYDQVKQQTFYRPLGGTIEFGEQSADAVRREFREEIGAELEDLSYLGALENIFTCGGKMGHEIVVVYDGKLVEPSLYEQETFMGDELGTPFKALWVRTDEPGQGHPPIYSDGLLNLIRKTDAQAG